MRSLDIARLQSAPVELRVAAAEIAIAKGRVELDHQARLAAQHFAAIERLTWERDAARAALASLRHRTLVEIKATIEALDGAVDALARDSGEED